MLEFIYHEPYELARLLHFPLHNYCRFCQPLVPLWRIFYVPVVDFMYFVCFCNICEFLKHALQYIVCQFSLFMDNLCTNDIKLVMTLVLAVFSY